MERMNFRDLAVLFYPKPIPGYVYAVQFDDGRVKIGSTSNATERFYRLQFYYRDKKTRIDRVYISDHVEDSRECERQAQKGLKPVEKKEVYRISFGEAIRRIKRATKTEDGFITNGRAETEREFPCLVPTQEKYYAAVEKIFSLAQELRTKTD